MKTCYYAHSMQIYDSTSEQLERAFLEQFYKVTCPNRDIGERGRMEPYIQRVATCDIVVCSEVAGHIGRGVYEEVRHAMKLRKPVYCLRSSPKTGTILRRVNSAQIANPDDWVFTYATLKRGTEYKPRRAS